MKEYEEKDSRIQVYSQDNKGIGFTRNRCIQYANTDWIFVMDADDIMLPFICSGPSL